MELARSVLLAAGVSLSVIGLACSGEDIGVASAALESHAAVAWSRSPPGGLSPWQVPQFVALTFDDNFTSGLNDVKGGMTWATTFTKPLVNPASKMQAGTFDGAPLRATFYFTSLYIDGDMLNLKAWRTAFADGHEPADHTRNHSMGGAFTLAQWTDEIQACKQALTDPMNGIGAMPSDVVGFRAPYLAYNASSFSVLASQSFLYDTSIQSCFDDGEDGTNCAWPYTLDQGSPDAVVLTRKFLDAAIDRYPGLWEAPMAALVVPPDSLADRYQFMPGLRARLAALGLMPFIYEPSTGKIAPLDINLFVDAKMTSSEVTATLEYSLDLHLAGNRAPMVFVAHSHVYASNYNIPVGAPDYIDRQQAIERFIAYAQSKPDVRARPVRDIIAWMQQPVALGDAVRPEAGAPGTDASEAGVAAGDASVPIVPDGGAVGDAGAGGAPITGPKDAAAGVVKKTPEKSGFDCTCKITRGVRPDFAALGLLGPFAFGVRRRARRRREGTTQSGSPNA